MKKTERKEQLEEGLWVGWFRKRRVAENEREGNWKKMRFWEWKQSIREKFFNRVFFGRKTCSTLSEGKSLEGINTGTIAMSCQNLCFYGLHSSFLKTKTSFCEVGLPPTMFFVKDKTYSREKQNLMFSLCA